LLDRGVVATGEATISVAGVDLVYLGLNLVLSSVETLRRSGGAAGRLTRTAPSGDPPVASQPVPAHRGRVPTLESLSVVVPPPPRVAAEPDEADLELLRAQLAQLRGALPSRVDVDPENAA